MITRKATTKSKPINQPAAEPAGLQVLSNLEAFVELGRKVLEGQHGISHDGLENIRRGIRAAELAAQQEKARI